METVSNQAATQSQTGRRSKLTSAVVCTACFTLVLVVVLARAGKAASPQGSMNPRLSRLHQRNRFFNPASAAAASSSDGTPVASFPRGDEVVSLKEVPVAEPMAAVIPASMGIPGPSTPLDFHPLATDIVKDQTKLIALGKALFWDMQVGSDGVQACATCHFNAGADIRTTNQINSGQNSEDFHSTANPAPPPCPQMPAGTPNPLTGDSNYGNSTVPFTANDPLTPNPPGPSDPPPASLNVPGLPSFGPNATVVGGNFPLNDWGHPTKLVPRGIGSIKVSLAEEFADATQDTNDAVTSQGIRLTQFTGVTPGSALDIGTPLCDIANTTTPGIPSLSGVMRRTEPRNAPTMINAVFNFDNLWDGKASFIFNGVDAFGFRNRTGTLKRTDSNGVLTDVFLRVTNSSLASVGADVPTSKVTMSFQGRTMRDVGKKMLSLRPLARQKVHSQDSVLGRLAREEGAGLNVATYADMIRAAFQDQWTSNTLVAPANKYTQAEFNFSMFFGLSVQAYMATLISDDTPFDRFEGALHPVRQKNGDPCPAGGCPPIPADPNALTPQEQAGYTLFNDVVPNIGTHCADCHVPPIMSSHTILDNQPNSQGVPSLTQGEAIEFMKMGDDLAEANYDHGFYNIGLRRTTDDKGRIATGGTTNPLHPTVSIASISRKGGVVTVKTDPHTTFPGLAKKDTVTIAGVVDTSFNGTFAVTSVSVSQKDLSSTFTYSQAPTLPDTSSTGGTASAPAKAFPFSLVELTALRDSHACDTATISHIGCLPPDVARFVPNIPILQRRVTHGAFKVPILRNLTFSGPYFHVGDSATLRQVVEFYTRGGNFPNTNLHDKTVDIDGIPGLDVTLDPTAEERIRALVAFLADGLTDPRVAFERAPFDHPEICVPNGAPTGTGAAEFRGCGGQLDATKDVFIDVPAVGRHGRSKELPTFLNLDPQQSDTSIPASGDGEGSGHAAAAGTGGTAQTGGYLANVNVPAGGPASTQAATVKSALIKGKDLNGQVPAGFAEAGYFEAATLDNASANSGGTVTINGTKMIVPANSIIQFPANTLTWAQFFNTVGNKLLTPVYDPALNSTQVNLTIAAGTTGLAMMDNPTRIQTQSPFIPFNAVVIGNIDVQGTTINNVTGAANAPGTYIVGLILPMGQDLGNAGQGFITCIDYGKSRFEVGGTVSTLPGGACGATPTGQVVEINDPSGRYGYAHSPDPRWSVDPDNPTIAAGNGYPMGIPKVAPPAIDPDRPAFNRLTNPTNTADPNYDPLLQPGAPLLAYAMPPSAAAGATQPDPWKQAPFLVGDYVIYSGILCKNNPAVPFNPAAPLNQQTYISANTVSATQLMIYTAPGAFPGDTSVGPAYMQVARGVIGTGPRPSAAPPTLTVPPNPAFGVVGGTIPIIDPKLKMVLVGFVTDPSQLVDVYAADIIGGVEVDRLLGFALPNPGVPGPLPTSPPRGPAGRFRFEVDRSDLQPTTRVYLAQSEHGQVQVPNQTGNIVPAEGGLISGQYHAPMFGFIYPDPVPGFPVIPNNFNSQDFLRLGEGGNPSSGPLTPFPPCLSFSGDPSCP